LPSVPRCLTAAESCPIGALEKKIKCRSDRRRQQLTSLSTRVINLCLQFLVVLGLITSGFCTLAARIKL
jgi:hypothetical protein